VQRLRAGEQVDGFLLAGEYKFAGALTREKANGKSDPLYSVEAAARYLGGLSRYTIHAWLSSGKLRRTKVGSRTMIRESELERVIRDGDKSPGRERS
jgi:excisionase family DNA binding protein